MPIDPTGATGAAALTSGTDKKKDAAFMGKEDFLKLLVAQLKNQDPSNAQDMEGMTQQMTQFSMLEQLTNLAESTQATNVSLAHSQAIEMLGKTVSYIGDDGTEKEGVVEHVTTSASGPMLTVGGTDGVLLGDVVKVR
jgi:flagellar basal-body rod modification protein FlgD